MPSISDDDLRNLITAGKIIGITFDTSIFNQLSKDLEFTTFQRLDQFRNGHVRVIVSEIVSKEIISHIRQDALETKNNLHKALVAHIKRWKLEVSVGDLEQAWRNGDDPSGVAESQFEKFCRAVNAEIVPAVYSVEVASEVIRRYFDGIAPFKAGGKKKAEFPDAFALLSLEEFARRAHGFVLCVSTDGDWISFANESDIIVCVNELGAALSLFNDAERHVVDRLVDALTREEYTEIKQEIESSIEVMLEGDFDCVVDSSVDVDAEADSAILQSVDWKTIARPKVVAQDADSVTLAVKVSASIIYSANVAFFKRDGIDKDIVNLGSRHVDKVQEAQFELAVNILREGGGDPVLGHVALAARPPRVDFGHVEPFFYEDPL